MFSTLSVLLALTLAVALSSTIVAAGPHDTPQRRHGHTGLSRIMTNNTLSPNNNTLASREDNARFTMYYQTGNAGACGIWNSDSDFIVALNWQQYESEDWCFKMIEINIGGKSHQAQIVDECPGCPWGALDCTPAIANYFGFFNDETFGSWNLIGEPTSSSKPPPPPPTTTHKSSSAPPPPPKTTSKHTTSSSSVWSAPPTSSSSVWSAPTSSSSSSRSSSSSHHSSSASSSSSTASLTSTSTASTPSATPTSVIVQLNASFLNMALLALAGESSK